MFERRNWGKLGIVFALEAEARGFLRVLGNLPSLVGRDKRTNTWFVGGVEVEITISGAGRERSEAATEQLISRGANWIVCAGFAGALDRVVNVGDVLIANRVMLAADPDSAAIEADESLIRAAPPAGTLDYAIRYGDLATGDAVVSQISEKAVLQRVTSAAAVDMESYAAALACARRGVPFAAIRAISDDASQEIPAEVQELAVMTSAFRRMMFCAGRPSLWRQLLRLRSQANTAAGNLGDLLGMMLLRLM